jgi:PAS domain S-box-containing protein
LRRATLERADRSGHMAVSQPLHLVGIDPAYARGVLLLAPVTEEGAAKGSAQGYVMAVISMQQLLADGLPEEPRISSRCVFSTCPPTISMKCSTSPPTRPGPATCRPHAWFAWPTMIIKWTFSPARHFYRPTILPSAAWWCWALLSLLLSALLYVLVSQRQRALRMVELRTQELHAREQELRGTHGQLRGVLNAATQVAIIATDLRGVINTFNPGAEQMLGYSSTDVVGHMTLENLHLPRELAARSAELSARYGKSIPTCHAMLVEGGEVGGHEAREWTLVRSDGSYLPVNMLATPVLDEQGLWVGHLAICIDITERKRVHEALAARDVLLKKLSAHVPGGIYQFKMEFDGRFSVIYASDGIREIYELEPDVLLLNAEAIFTAFIRRTFAGAQLDPRFGGQPQPMARGIPRAVARARPALGARRGDAGGTAGRRRAVAWLHLGHFRLETGGRGTAGAVGHRLADRHPQPPLFPGTPDHRNGPGRARRR